MTIQIKLSRNVELWNFFPVFASQKVIPRIETLRFLFLYNCSSLSLSLLSLCTFESSLFRKRTNYGEALLCASPPFVVWLPIEKTIQKLLYGRFYGDSRFYHSNLNWHNEEVRCCSFVPCGLGGCSRCGRKHNRGKMISSFQNKKHRVCNIVYKYPINIFSKLKIGNYKTELNFD